MNGQEVLLLLLRSGLHGQPLQDGELAAVSKLKEQHWRWLLNLAGRQTVTGLVYSAVEILPADVEVPPDIIMELMAANLAIERDSSHKKDVSARLCSSLQEAGLSPVLMKGSSVAEHYPHPLRRVSGDIDICLPEEEANKAFEMLSGQCSAPDGSLHCKIEGIDIDIHRRYFDLHIAQRLLPAPGSAEAELLMLSSHILKHAAGTGVGLRQFCDLAAAWKAHAGNIDASLLRRAERSSRIRRWDRLAASFLAQKLDTPQMLESLFPGQQACDTEPLMKIVFEGGNFGHFAANRGEVLGSGAARRKRDTVSRFLHHLPFSLRYAPRETLFTIRELVRGNLKRRRG